MARTLLRIAYWVSTAGCVLAILYSVYLTSVESGLLLLTAVVAGGLCVAAAVFGILLARYEGPTPVAGLTPPLKAWGGQRKPITEVMGLSLPPLA